MIDCPNGDVRDVLPDYVNDRLAAPARAEVEQHLASCGACRDEVDLLRGLRTTLRRAPAVDVDAISAAIAPYRAPSSAVAGRRWAADWRIAAAIAAIAIGGTSVALLRDGGPADGDGGSTAVVAGPARGVDASPGAVSTPVTPAPDVVRIDTPAARSPDSPPARELAMAAGAIGELSDGELSALVEGLESLDALPSAEVEAAEALPASTLEEPS